MRLIDADKLHYSRIRIAHSDGTIGGYNAVVMSAEIKDAPTIEPEQKHGKWLNAEHAPNYLCYCTCSVCGKRQTIEIANYCPNCGARMEEPE